MIEEFRRFLTSPSGKIAAVVVTLGLLVAALYSTRGFFKGDTPDEAFYTTFVCSETGKSFHHKNELGETLPILSPYSGKKTGWPGEACYWTADGKIKKEPTWVLLNGVVGKTEPTFCPDCGRLVVGHNPPPREGHPPPTQAEWAARH